MDQENSKRRGRPPATSRDIEAAREAVIMASYPVYAEHGYDGLSVERIIAAADISRPTFYKLFANKHEVVEPLVWRASRELLARVKGAAQKTREPVERLGAIADAWLNWARELGPLVRILYREINHPESPADSARRWLIEALREVFQAHSREAGMERLDPLFLDTLVMVMEHTSASLFDHGAPTSAAITRRRRIILRILIASLARPAEYAAIPPLPRQPEFVTLDTRQHATTKQSPATPENDRD